MMPTPCLLAARSQSPRPRSDVSATSTWHSSRRWIPSRTTLHRSEPDLDLLDPPPSPSSAVLPRLVWMSLSAHVLQAKVHRDVLRLLSPLAKCPIVLSNRVPG